MKKKSTRFTILILSLSVTVLLVIGAVVFLALKGGLLSTVNTRETQSEVANNDETTHIVSEQPDTEPIINELSTNATIESGPIESETVSEEGSSETPTQTEENTTEESEIVWPHERKGVWAAFSHAEKEEDLDASMTLFSDASVPSKNALRLFGKQINRLVFFNDSKSDCRILFDTSVSTDEQEPVFTLKPGEEKEFRFTVKENVTANYQLAYSGKAGNTCYIQNNEQLVRINREFPLSEGTVVSIEGAASAYDIHELYQLPPCEILWKGSGVTGRFIALNTNATKWNDELIAGNYPVGGASGVELNSVSILPAQNAFTNRELKYKQSGNAFKVAIPIDIAQEGTTNARLNISANGNIELSGEGANPDGTVDLFKTVICKVTNLKGESHSYQLTGTYESYNVPVVYITTSNGKSVTSKSKYITGTFSMDADNVPGVESIPNMTMQIKGRGHSTWKKDKKPFTIKFDQKVSVLGLPANRDWVLLANYFDPTMSRNYIAFELARKLNFDFTPTTFPVQVIFNGKYIGMYCIGDKVEIATSRVNQTEHSAAVDRDYLIEVRGYESGYRMGQSAFTAGLLREIAIKNPEPEEITPEQYKYISEYVKAANEAVVNLSNYEDYIDLDSLIDWFIITELTYNCDGAFNRSVFIQKRAGGKLTFSPVWDFDLAFGNISNLTPDYDTWACSQNGFSDTDITWGTYLVQDPKFRDRLQKRWEQVRQTLRATATQSLATMRHLMDKAGDANFAMWVTPGERLGWEWEFASKYTDYKLHIGYIEVFLEKRFNVLDKVIIDRVPMRRFVDGQILGEPILNTTMYPLFEILTKPGAVVPPTQETEDETEPTSDVTVETDTETQEEASSTAEMPSATEEHSTAETTEISEIPESPPAETQTPPAATAVQETTAKPAPEPTKAVETTTGKTDGSKADSEETK